MAKEPPSLEFIEGLAGLTPLSLALSQRARGLLETLTNY
jgi:hypothetical protein